MSKTVKLPGKNSNADLKENLKALMNVMGNVAREYPVKEMTQNPIFLLQARYPFYDEDGDELEQCPENWDTVSVWFTREEAEEFRSSHAYRWPDGSRIYCIPAGGELAKLLKVVTTKEKP